MNRVTKSKRERQLDQTRQWEWIYYVACAVAFGVAFAVEASNTVMAVLFASVMVFGSLIWLWQYRVNDELGRLRIMKSWAVVGVTNVLALSGLVIWAALRFFPMPQKMTFENLHLPFWPVYLLLLFNCFLLSGAMSYFRWQEERE